MQKRSSFGRSDGFEGWQKALFIIGVLGVVLLIAFLAHKQFLASPVKKDTYQLVSLSTGEVYFGKIQNINDEYVELKQAYTQAADSKEATQQGGVVLNRLSVSVAKPEDTMFIARDKIVHWENLQKDSKIVQAIENDNK